MNERSGRSRTLAWLLVAGGLVVNPWTVGWAASDGRFGAAAPFLAILALQAIALITGAIWLARPKRRWRVAGLAFLIGWAVFYLGWVLSRSLRPDIGWYSWAYLVFLFVVAVPFVFPAVIGAMRRRLGTRNALLALSPLTALLVVGYGLGAAWYWFVREQRFDPFLQYPPALSLPETLPTGAGLDVLALGGSTTENRWMDPELRYPALLESALAGSVPEAPRVWNAGRAWYTTRHSLSTYTDYYYRLRPDVVVIMHAINDVVRSCTPPTFASGDYTDRWTHYYGASIRGARPRPFWVRLADLAVVDEAGAAEAWYSVVRHRDTAVPLESFVSRRQYARNLERLVDVARGDGARVVVVTQPSVYGASPAVHPTPRGMGERFCLTSDDYAARTYPDDPSMRAAMDAFNDTAREIARCRGATVADAAAPMDSRSSWFWDDVHYTAAGSLELAMIVADAVAEAVGGPPPEPAGCRAP